MAKNHFGGYPLKSWYKLGWQKWSLKGFGGAQGSFWAAWWTSQELVRFWTPFSEKMCQHHCVFHGLGAARRSEPDQADEAEMVHGRQLGP